MHKEIKLIYLKKPSKFLKKNLHIVKEEDVDALIILGIRKKIFLENVSLDIKELKGNLHDKYRIRKGKIRIIFTIKEGDVIIESIIEDIDFRGNIY